ncbi:hypothetical protein ABPG75_009716 [Micractinium tetrahymenae]
MAQRAKAAACLLLALARVAAASGIGPSVSLKVIHLNDNHARFEPADVNFGTQCDGAASAACFGGFARLSTAISEAKAAAARDGMDTLVLHAGDEYTGSLWDAVFTKEGIQIAPAFLTQIGVQAFTLGNHEMDSGPTGDAGLEGFARNVSGAFPILSCNLDISGQPALEGLVQRYALVQLERSGATVGIVGLTSVETPETSSPGPTVKFLPYDEVLPGCVADARAAGADFIIALTHIGFDDDRQLAASPAAAGVDLFVGGHSHTLLWGEPQPVGQEQVATQPPPLLLSPPTNESTVAEGPYPTLVANAAGNKTIPVVQALYASRYLGVLDTTWELGRGLVAYSGQPVLLGGANSTDPVADDPVVVGMLDALSGPIDAANSQVIGPSLVDLDGDRGQVRNGETNLGDLQCEAMLQFVATSTGLLEQNPGVPAVCLVNGGGIRASIAAGNVTAGQVAAVWPFGNWLVAKKVDGLTLLAALNNGLSGWTGNDSAAGRFPQVGGMRLSFDPSSRPEDSRLVAVELLVDGASLPLSSYSGSIILLTNDYMSKGGDFYEMLQDEPNGNATLLYDSSTPLDTVVSAYFEEASPVNITTDGRIVNCAISPTNLLCTAGGAQQAAEPSAPAPAPSGRAARRLARW